MNIFEKIINTILVVVFSIMAIVALGTAFREIGILKVIMAFVIIIVGFGGIIFLFMKIINVGEIAAKKSVKREILSKIDFAKDKGIYREILEKYSIAEVSYIDSLEVNVERDIIASLLNLKLKGKIDIKDNKIVIINENTNGLDKVEKYIMESIEDYKVRVKKPEYFLEKYVREEAVEKELIHKGRDEIIREYVQKNKGNIEFTRREWKKMDKYGMQNASGEFREILKNKRKKIKFVEIMSILVCVLGFWCVNIGKEYIDKNSESIFTEEMLFFGLALLMGISISFCSTYTTKLDRSTKRTKKGEELNEKIEGLKNYIQNYSLLEESKQNELALWDEYLIYSVIFDINTKIIEDMSHLIEID